MDTTQTPKTTTRSLRNPRPTERQSRDAAARGAAAVATPAPTSAISYGDAMGSDDGDGGNVARVCVTAASRAVTHRTLKAAALRLQAAVEDLSAAEQWISSVRMVSDTVAVVELELLTSGARELRAALSTLGDAVRFVKNFRLTERY